MIRLQKVNLSKYTFDQIVVHLTVVMGMTSHWLLLCKRKNTSKSRMKTQIPPTLVKSISELVNQKFGFINGVDNVN